ncbi:hypothetical protein ACU8KH_02165 [Lachancea thermotolerans]
MNNEIHHNNKLTSPTPPIMNLFTLRLMEFRLGSSITLAKSRVQALHKYSHTFISCDSQQNYQALIKAISCSLAFKIKRLLYRVFPLGGPPIQLMVL